GEAGAGRLYPVRMGRFRQQPESEVLHAHARRPKASRARNERVGTHDENRRAIPVSVKGAAVSQSASVIARLIKSVRVWCRRVLEMPRKQRQDDDLNAEIEANLGLQIEDNIRAGMSWQEARRAALLKFGSVEGIKEQVRDRRGIPFMETLIQDIRLALR